MVVPKRPHATFLHLCPRQSAPRCAMWLSNRAPTDREVANPVAPASLAFEKPLDKGKHQHADPIDLAHSAQDGN